MLILKEFSHNHHPPRVKMLAKYIRRGISVILFFSNDAKRRRILQLREVSHNHHPSRVKILAEKIRRGISVIITGE